MSDEKDDIDVLVDDPLCRRLLTRADELTAVTRLCKCARAVAGSSRGIYGERRRLCGTARVCLRVSLWCNESGSSLWRIDRLGNFYDEVTAGR